MANVENYLEARALYERVTAANPEAIKQAVELIDEFVDGKETVDSRSAGSSILAKCQSFRSACGSRLASAVFGILLREHLEADGWEMQEGTVGGKRTKLYIRP